MSDAFGIADLKVTDEDIERIDSVKLGPLARDFLSRSGTPRSAELASQDPAVARKAARDLARRYLVPAK